MLKRYYLVKHTSNFEWKLVSVLEEESTTDWHHLGRKFATKIGLDPQIVNRYGEFNYKDSRYYVVDQWAWDHEYSEKVAKNTL